MPTPRPWQVIKPSPVHPWGAAIFVDGVLIAEMAAEYADEAARAVNAHDALEHAVVSSRNTLDALAAFLEPEWTAAAEVVGEAGNSGWTMIAKLAIRKRMDALVAALEACVEDIEASVASDENEGWNPVESRTVLAQARAALRAAKGEA